MTRKPGYPESGKEKRYKNKIYARSGIFMLAQTDL